MQKQKGGGGCTSFLGTISALILLQMLAILQTLPPEKAHLINLSTLNNHKLNKTTQMVLEKPINHIKHLKWPFAHLSAQVTTFACSGCLICIQRVVFASSKACSFLQNMSVGAGFCMHCVRSRQAQGRRAAFGARQRALVTCCIPASAMLLLRWLDHPMR